ncbi:MAG: hypothetical protein ACOYBP_06900 [Microbacteriaceae bacterium]
MSIQFDAPPQSRRELREREELLRRAGASEEEAQRLAGETGVFDFGGADPAQPSELIAAVFPSAPLNAIRIDTDVPAPAPAVAEPMAQPIATAPVEEPMAQPIATAPVEEATVPARETLDEPTAESVNFERAEPEEFAEPEVIIDFEVVEVVEQIFSQPLPVQDTPASIPLEPSTATGPIHWTEALTMPADLDPTDPASIVDIPALASDTNTIVLEETIDIHEVANQTGEIQLMVTGSILLPTELTETGALAEMIESQDLDFSSTEIDEVSMSRLNPVSALSAVSASVETPALIADPPKEKLSTAVLISLIAGGAAAVVLIALGVGALFHLF